jgi:hypothetical protein
VSRVSIEAVIAVLPPRPARVVARARELDRRAERFERDAARSRHEKLAVTADALAERAGQCRREALATRRPPLARQLPVRWTCLPAYPGGAGRTGSRLESAPLLAGPVTIAAERDLASLTYLAR